MTVGDFDFVGDAYQARSIYQDAQICLNFYPEIDKQRGPDGRGVVALYPTPGKLLQITFPDAAEVRALYVCSGSTVMIAVCGSSVYNVTTGLAYTKVGTLSTSSGPVSVADNGAWAMLCDGNSRYVYNWTTGYFSSMTTVSFYAWATASSTTLNVTSVVSGVVGNYQTVTGPAGLGSSSGTTNSIASGGFLSGAGTLTLGVATSAAVGTSTSPVLITATDGGFTSGGYVAEVDTFFIYTNPGTNQWGSSSSNSPVSPNVPPALSQKDGAADNLVSMIVNNREVFLLGERTTEVWVDQGSFPFPFARLPGTSSQHGVIAPYSVSRIGESFAWLGRDSRGQGYVYRMNGYIPERISTYAIENAIAGYGIISDARAWTYQQGGHEFYVLTFPSADATWVFDVTTEMWHQRAWRDSLNVLHRDRGNCAAIYANQVLVGDWQNGNLYALSLSTYTDNGSPIYRMRQCPHLTKDLKRVFHHELQIQFQPGVGLSTGTTNPQAMLQYSNDGGSTWSSERWTGVGAIGQYTNRAVWRRLGASRDRIYRVVCTDPVNFTIISANLYASEAAH